LPQRAGPEDLDVEGGGHVNQNGRTLQFDTEEESKTIEDESAYNDIYKTEISTDRRRG